MKREFVQLAHMLNMDKHRITGMMMSEKLDGMRAIWDGGASRGIPTEDVPWANTAKDARFKVPQVATGLWSRYGKALHAPDWFLDFLPTGCILDGELWAGVGKFQQVTSTVRSLNKNKEWGEIDYMVLDLVDPDIIFAPGLISNTNFNKVLTDTSIKFWNSQILTDHIKVPKRFSARYKLLIEMVGMRPGCTLHSQVMTPLNTIKAKATIELFLEYVLQIKGEGVILRNPDTLWQACRTKDVLKYKPHHDAEGMVCGYTWGRETDKGSKLLGKMGALILRIDDHDFKLSGFTDAERSMEWLDGRDATEWGKGCPGVDCIGEIHNPMFPRGSQITFKYRELSDDGVPKEARYWRKV